MISLKNLLLEDKEGSKYEFGCVMLYFEFPQLNKIHKIIDSNDVYELEGEGRNFGLESEPHVTLLYGLHEGVSTEQIKQVTDQFEFGPKPLRIDNVSLFENQDYDVLKFDFNDEILNNINNELLQFPHTNNYPDYHPHLTIGYLKPGTGKKYIKIFEELGFNLEPEYIVYSKPNGNKDKIEINKKYE